MKTAFWITWSIAMALSLTGWLAIQAAVEWGVRRAILLVPLERKLAAGTGGFSISLADVDAGMAKLKEGISAGFRFYPLRWLVERAVASHFDWFVRSAREFCSARSVAVIEGPLLGAWMHSVVAAKVGEFAGDIASGFLRTLCLVLCVVGVSAYFGIR